MFKKAHTTKPISPLRSSDRRKLINEAIINLPLLSKLNSNGLDLILPKSITCGKISTHLDLLAIVYYGNSEPIFIKVDDKLLPTVYTLWKIPQTYPMIFTNQFVFTKLVNGADLMAPGIFISEEKEGLPDLPVDQIVVISTLDGEFSGYPLAIGILLQSTNLIKKEQSGKAVQIYHTYLDHLWLAGSKTNPSLKSKLGNDCFGDEIDDSLLIESNEINQLVEEVNELELEPKVKLTVQETDDLLMISLYQALSSSFDLTHSKPLLPLSITIFYTNYIQPSRPLDTEFDIKNSSFKKLAKFIKVMEKKGLFSTKEINNVIHIKSIDYDYSELVGFKPLKDNRTVGGNISNVETKSTKDDVIDAIQLYQPSNNMIGLFQKSCTKLYSYSEVKAILLYHIQRGNLINPKNKGQLILDPIMANVLELNQLDVIYMTRDQMLTKLLDKMQPYYRIQVPGYEPLEQKGFIPKLLLTIEKKMGNKLMTKISNLEPYHIDKDQLSKKLTVLCASSTTISTTTLSKNLLSYQVSVQGNQSKIILKYLESIGLSNKLVDIIDKTKGKKK